MPSFQVAGQRSRFAGHAFHQVAVAANAVSIVVDDFQIAFIVSRRKLRFRQSHADGHRQTLAQRSRRGVYARSMSEFRVARRFAAPLAELLDFFHRQIIPAQMQQAVQQHRAVSGGQDEAVAVDPIRNVRVMVHRFGKQLVTHRCGPHRHAGMAGLRLFDRRSPASESS